MFQTIENAQFYQIKWIDYMHKKAFLRNAVTSPLRYIIYINFENKVLGFLQLFCFQWHITPIILVIIVALLASV